MGKRGPGKKPTAIVKMEGARTDMMAPRQREPAPPGVPTPPIDLEGEAKKHWDEVVPILINMGVATSVDSHALTQMCHWWAEWKKLADRETKPITALQTASYNWLRLAGRFGLTPSDRADIRTEPGRMPGDSVRELLA